MFKVTRNGENRIDVDFAGKLNSADMQMALNQLIEHSEGIRHGRILYRISEFEFPTLGAIAIELSRIPELFRFVRQFDRIAVIADKEWLRKASEIEGALIPGLTIKAFDPTEKAAAETWLME
jgi:hypothetical protein